MVNLIIPDQWQQDAVNALRAGRDLVVHAPTGAGKTYIFELFYDSIKGQAVYTVPTRALANDKLAEWKARGWDVGIATGDVAENLNARVVVATLETQKSRFIRKDGPKLLVVDEYQLLADPVRGMNYELILSLAPPDTQILLLSGSVANPEDVASWLKRIGRNVEVIIHRDRPVPLEEIMLNHIPIQAPQFIRSFWPRLITRALLADMGPILIFAPRRNASEELAQTLSAALTNDEPLSLSNEQALAAGEPLAKLLRHRIAYHHSGLSYAVRAGLIEPLAKRGQLRVVVATMGLAAGINFSMRSVLITGAHYFVNNFQRQVRPDELLQMFGRAGRRGLDEVGFALVTPDVPRLHEAYPLKLKRAEPIDWPSFIALMQAAALRRTDPFAEAMQLSRRLFTPKELTIGVERFYQTGTQPCGLRVDVERGRFVRRQRTEILNSRGEWEIPEEHGKTTLGQLWARKADGRWRPALSVAASLSGIGIGNLCKFKSKEGVEYGREVAVAIRRDSEWHLLRWLRKLFKEKFPLLQVPGLVSEPVFQTVLLPIVSQHVRGNFAEFETRNQLVLARFKFGQTEAEGYLEK
ncbi:MAG: DEAD/DEAH box helicase, partial [Verrucomicrobia bacterium]|nr:DEAD/DEAH box helicase [Verrucomicrobiota bacterium]